MLFVRTAINQKHAGSHPEIPLLTPSKTLFHDCGVSYLSCHKNNFKLITVTETHEIGREMNTFVSGLEPILWQAMGDELVMQM